MAGITITVVICVCTILTEVHEPPTSLYCLFQTELKFCQTTFTYSTINMHVCGKRVYAFWKLCTDESCTSGGCKFTHYSLATSLGRRSDWRSCELTGLFCLQLCKL